MANNTDRTPATHEGHHVPTETKASTKTTEFYVYIAVLLAIIVTAFVVGDSTEGGEGGDPFGAEHAIRYITFLTIGYMVARGLAKSGSRAHHDAHNTTN